MKVPAVKPPPGRVGTDTPTVTSEGAVPLGAEIVSQLPPSEVVLVRVQFNIPDPPFRICMAWLGGDKPPVLSEKLVCPGRLSKNVPPAAATVKVTGMVIDTVPDCEVTTICPV